LHLPTCASTNTVASELLLKNKATEGCVVITDHQTAGRGQRGNTWDAEPDKNITLSLILKPVFLSIPQQFFLTIITSLAVLDTIQENIPATVKVKWPNDIMAGDKKLAGILIENSISGHYLQHSVVGIGLNVNQKIFAHSLASSLTLLTEKEYNRVTLTERLLEHLEKRYLELKAGRLAKLKFEYLQQLYWYQEPRWFLVNEDNVRGQIMGVDETGRLALQIESKLYYFNLKEIAYLPDFSSKT
jgi:BirA family biotin operon repressor/biotin-[acetyl-CoA-carboxylase] ligase